MRIFIAIEIPRNIKERLVEVQEKLKPQLPGVRWEKPEKLHITLVFLGQVPEERIADLEKAVRKGVSPAPPQHHPVRGRRGVQGKGFNVGFSEVGFFPNERRPRVVLMEVGDGIERVVELQRRLAEALAGGGFEFAKLSKPHVTLGRFRRGADATRRVNWDSTLRVGDFRVKEVVVVESKLHPAGAIHTPIARVPLC